MRRLRNVGARLRRVACAIGSNERVRRAGVDRGRRPVRGVIDGHVRAGDGIDRSGLRFVRLVRRVPARRPCVLGGGIGRGRRCGRRRMVRSPCASRRRECEKEGGTRPRAPCAPPTRKPHHPSKYTANRVMANDASSALSCKPGYQRASRGTSGRPGSRRWSRTECRPARRGGLAGMSSDTSRLPRWAEGRAPGSTPHPRGSSSRSRTTGRRRRTPDLSARTSDRIPAHRRPGSSTHRPRRRTSQCRRAPSPWGRPWSHWKILRRCSLFGPPTSYCPRSRSSGRRSRSSAE
jgi:hypothetical protein